MNMTQEYVDEVKTPYKRRKIHYYDLDGTLSSLNSTFDFIHGYLKHNNRYLKYYKGKFTAIFLIHTKRYHPVKSRRLLINMYFRGLKKADLEDYFEKIYKPLFLDSLTPLGSALRENRDTADVMITGCTEVPAKKIAECFGFKEVICTEFFFKNGRIKGIKTDTYGNFKIKFITRRKERMIYFTDDLKSEESLIPMMDEIHEV